MLTISDYKDKKRPAEIGQIARMKVSKKASGVIFQHVTHTTKLDSERTVEKFTEGWAVRDGRVRPAPEDLFLVPKSWHDVDGHVHIKGKMWFVEGKPTDILKATGLKLNAVDIAGTLHARYGQVPPAYRSKNNAINREWTATWKATKYKKDFKPAFKSKTSHEA